MVTKIDEKLLPKMFPQNIKIELWARMILIFCVLRGSAGGLILNEFLIGPKTSKNLKNRVGGAKRMILGAGGGGTPG